jgi:hypothetical protein
MEFYSADIEIPMSGWNTLPNHPKRITQERTTHRKISQTRITQGRVVERGAAEEGTADQEAGAGTPEGQAKESEGKENPEATDCGKGDEEPTAGSLRGPDVQHTLHLNLEPSSASRGERSCSGSQ